MRSRGDPLSKPAPAVRARAREASIILRTITSFRTEVQNDAVRVAAGGPVIHYHGLSIEFTSVFLISDIEHTVSTRGGQYGGAPMIGLANSARSACSMNAKICSGSVPSGAWF
jgi:hypothetical protein